MSTISRYKQLKEILEEDEENIFDAVAAKSRVIATSLIFWNSLLIQGRKALPTLPCMISSFNRIFIFLSFPMKVVASHTRFYTDECDKKIQRFFIKNQGQSFGSLFLQCGSFHQS